MTVCKTWLELANKLGIAQGTISRWRKDKTAPKKKDLVAWKRFVAEREAMSKQGTGRVTVGGASFSAADVIDLKAKLVKEQGEGQAIRNQLNTLELKQKSEGLVPMAEAQAAMKEVLEPLSRLLESLPKAVAVRANPADPHLAEEACRDGLDQVFKLMQQSKNGT
jgi:transcriptional regulator with XRE-family HTH domain